MMPENYHYQTRLLHVYFSEQHVFNKTCEM